MYWLLLYGGGGVAGLRDIEYEAMCGKDGKGFG